MSARNYQSARVKNFEFDCLPSISKSVFSKGSELPRLSATSSYNRNLNSYTYEQSYIQHANTERGGTPFSDFFSESETGTPDFHSEESDSSAGSALRRSNAEATQMLLDEWERIERTLYDEAGEKSTRPQIVEECKQWRALHPQLRVVGRGLRLPEIRPGLKCSEYYDEIVMIHYGDNTKYNSESDELLSQSSTDVTPQNSPRESCENLNATNDLQSKPHDIYEPKLMREKMPIFLPHGKERELPDSFCSLLHITPLQARSPTHRKRQNVSILKSEIASSSWMNNTRPDSSNICDRNSAKSFVSLDPRNYGVALSASERNKMFTSRVLTARYRDMPRLDPLCTPDIPPSEMSRTSNNLSYRYNVRKVSLPPLMLEEEKRKVVHSAKKHNKPRRNVPKNSHLLDKMRHSK